MTNLYSLGSHNPLAIRAMQETHYSKEEIEREFIRYWSMGAVAERWSDFCDLYTSDAVLVNQVQGFVLTGRENIRKWLLPTMNDYIPELYTVYGWHLIQGSVVVNGMINRRDNPQRGETPIDFHGITVQVYAGNGKWSYQEDYYSSAFGEAATQHYHEQREKFCPDHNSLRTRLDWGDGPHWTKGAPTYMSHPE